MQDSDLSNLKAHHSLFVSRLMELSHSFVYSTAVTEWDFVKLVRLEAGEGSEECLCGHDIRWIFYLTNRITHNEIVVGSTCIQKFFGIDGQALSTAAERLYDPSKRVHPDIVAYAHKRGWVAQRTVDIIQQHKRIRSERKRASTLVVDANGNYHILLDWETRLREYLVSCVEYERASRGSDVADMQHNQEIAKSCS